ncbi:MAG: hypothetical protein ACYTG0_30175 [Planctomycetota bacterium]|jgi:hypothetical protein
MSRSERYIPPSDEELERQLQSIEAARQFDGEREELLRATLKKMEKVDLVELTLRVAQEGKASEWMLEQELGLTKPVNLLVHDIEVAIDIATKVDERRLNDNFEYDWRAYDAVRRGLSQLIHNDRIEEAKAIALKLMQKGSFQIECSDEGLMQEEIESCLRPVIAAVAGSSGGREWALEMRQHDRMRFLCQQELAELAGLKEQGRQKRLDVSQDTFSSRSTSTKRTIDPSDLTR